MLVLRRHLVASDGFSWRANRGWRENATLTRYNFTEESQDHLEYDPRSLTASAVDQYHLPFANRDDLVEIKARSYPKRGVYNRVGALKDAKDSINLEAMRVTSVFPELATRKGQGPSKFRR